MFIASAHSRQFKLSLSRCDKDQAMPTQTLSNKHAKLTISKRQALITAARTSLVE